MYLGPKWGHAMRPVVRGIAEDPLHNPLEAPNLFGAHQGCWDTSEIFQGSSNNDYLLGSSKSLVSCRCALGGPYFGPRQVLSPERIIEGDDFLGGCLRGSQETPRTSGRPVWAFFLAPNSFGAPMGSVEGLEFFEGCSW